MGELARCSAAAAASVAAPGAARPARLLLPLVLALLVHAGGASICDTANCGKGNCSETPGLLPPNYECRCDPGWSRALDIILFSPCIVPHCSFNSDCLNLGINLPPLPPTGIPDVCSIVSCGAGGTCKTAGGDPLSLSYSCECRPGYANLLNLTTLPCVNCFLGEECYDLGLGPPPAPAPAPAPPLAPAPSGDHRPAEPPAPPSGTKGSVSSPNLLQLLLMLLIPAVAMVQVV